MLQFGSRWGLCFQVLEARMCCWLTAGVGWVKVADEKQRNRWRTFGRLEETILFMQVYYVLSR